MLEHFLKILGLGIVSLGITSGIAAASNDIPDGSSPGLEYRSAWSCENNSKFYWYCEKQEEVEEEAGSDSKPKKQKQTKTPEEIAQEELEAFKKDLEGKRALAVMRPTPENVKKYIEAQEKMMQNSSVFSDVWQRVIWQTPDLNYELKRPRNNAAIAIYNDQRTKAQRSTLVGIAKEWGLFFIFKSDCPYCHKLGPTVKYVAEEYGITVMPISVDGIGIPSHPSPKKDNGIVSKLNIKQVPALVLGNIKDRRLIPLSSGLISAQEIVERIYILSSTKPGELY